MPATSLPRPTATSSTGRYLPLMLILFIGSGCAALIYEIVWYQMLQLVIGLTTISLGLLLGSFMGGMCIGSLAISRLVQRGRHPLRVYACLELGIGIIGLIELWLVPAVGAFYTDHAGGHDYWNIVMRGLVAAVCLVPPTLLMGATLPAIARWVETTPTGVSWLGFFYGGNIAGAVFGCLLAGFYLLRVHDMATATEVAAAINVVVALLAYALSSDNVRPPLEAPSDRTKPTPGAWAIYTSIGLSGLTALGAEVIWTRLLSLLLGGTVYTFSIILAVFLFGLGIGSSLGSFGTRSRIHPRVALGLCQILLMAGVAWASYNISHSLPHWPIDPTLVGGLRATADHLDGSWYVFQLDLAMTMWTVLPAAILWGASFPLALAAVAAPGQDPGRLVGGVYAANTVGAILGSLFFSITAVPLWGTQTSQQILIGLAALSAFIALGPLVLSRAEPAEDAEGRRTISALGAVVLLVLTLVGAPILGHVVSPPNWGTMAWGRFVATYLGVMEPEITPESAVPQGDGTSNVYCVYTGEGLNGTVAVTMTTAGVRSFHSAGKVQASNAPQDMRLQRMLGHLSALTTVKEPESVLVVACGAGVTAGTFLLHPSVKKITICDIEPLVPKYVTPMFTKENYGITDNVKNQNPRIVHTPVGDKIVEVVYDDGRHFIRTTKEKFDVITSDPIDPWVKGCAALNTVEYYTMCKEHLNPGGVMSLWIPFYESNDASAKSVLGTFFKVFPNGILWSNDYTGDGYDAVLFAQVAPTKINVDELTARLDSAPYAAVKQSLAEAGFSSVPQLLGTYAGRATDLGDWLAGAQINEDRNLRLQYIAGMAFNTYDGPGILRRIMDHYKFPANLFIGSRDAVLNVKQAIEDPRQLRKDGQSGPLTPTP